jgi:signal transduction histidine kinase
MKLTDEKKQIFFVTIIYFSSIFILLSAVYWFMLNNGFSQQNFLISSFGVLLVAFGWGYTLSSDLLAPKQNMDKKLTHLTKEILHELNIPLSTIKANTSMLKKSEFNEKSIKRLDRIDSASLRLVRLYDELVYAINKEIHSVKKEDFLLHKVINERVDVFKAFNRNNFEVKIDNNIYLYLDKIGFEQMIDNLINNAMKYSNKNTTISVILEEKILIIKDRGIGIDESKLVKIFERYYQANTQTQGDGIGLSLVKKYCDDMNIPIDIKSKKNIGTTIILNFSKLRF